MAFGRRGIFQRAGNPRGGESRVVEAGPVLPAVGPDLDTLTGSLLVDISGYTGDAQDIWLDSTGVQCFMCSDDPDDTITSHSLSTPWDITTIGAVDSEKTPTQRTFGLCAKDDGTKVYCGQIDGNIVEYTLSTPWDMTSASITHTYDFDNDSSTLAMALHITSDGSQIFVGGNGATVHRITLATPYDLSTASYDHSYNTSAQTTFNFGIAVDEAGGKLYVCDYTSTTIYQYTLGTPFDLTSASYASKSLPSIASGGTGLHFDGTNRNTELYQNTNANTKLAGSYEYLANDADFSSVVLLLDFAGSDGATDITDLSNSGHVDTFTNQAEVDTAVTALGRNTVLLDGAADVVHFPDSADWDFGTGDFTLECHFQSNTNAHNGAILSTYDAPNGWALQNLSGTALRFLNGDTALYSETWNPTEGQMYHLAVSRSGTDLRVFVDGAQLGGTVTDSTDFTGSTQGCVVGGLLPTTQTVDANIGAVRITKGVARYTQNFVPPANFYHTS